MEHPVRDVRSVIRSLCQGTPQEQRDAIKRYYVPSASLVHPFCRVPSFESFKVPLLGEFNSRDVILGIFKWYKILSPKVDLEIESAVFDQRSSLLYLTISQVFSIWFIPFHKAPVRLVTVLHLVPSNQQSQQQQSHSNNTSTNGNGTGRERHDDTTTPNHIHNPNPHHLNGTDEDEPSYAEVASGQAHPSSPNSNHRGSTNGSGSSGSSRSNGGPTRYLIKEQQDYYQINEFLKFILGIPGSYLWSIWQIFSTAFCILGALLLSPIMAVIGPYVAKVQGHGHGHGHGQSNVSLPLLSNLNLNLRRNSDYSRDGTIATPARQKTS